jgi:hypothetical protein
MVEDDCGGGLRIFGDSSFAVDSCVVVIINESIFLTPFHAPRKTTKHCTTTNRFMKEKREKSKEQGERGTASEVHLSTFIN